MNGAWMMYVMSFLSFAALLVWFAGREPEWVAPLLLVLLGVLSAARPRTAAEAEGRRRSRGMGRRFGVLAAILGTVLLLRSLGMM